MEYLLVFEYPDLAKPLLACTFTINKYAMPVQVDSKTITHSEITSTHGSYEETVDSDIVIIGLQTMVDPATIRT